MVFILSWNKSEAQETPSHSFFYSQIVKSPELYNPAFGANIYGYMAKLSYSSKYTSYASNPVSYAFTTSIPIVKSSLAVGFNFIQENIGLRQISSANLILSSGVKISADSYLSAGIKLGGKRMQYFKYKMNVYGNVNIDDIPNDYLKTALGVGVYYYDLYNFGGLSISDIFIDEVKVLNNFDLYAGRNFILDNFIFRASVLFKNYEKEQIYVLRNDIYYKGLVGLGLSYAINKEYSASIDLKVSDNLCLAYTYEYQTFKTYIKLSSYELSLSYNTNQIYSQFKRYSGK